MPPSCSTPATPHCCRCIKARGIPVATHVDGLEWRRDKWGPTGRRYYRAAESLAVRWSDTLIADSHGIQQYFADEFGAATNLIAYGAPILTGLGDDRIAEFDLAPRAYHLVVARFEPENHVREIVAGLRGQPGRAAAGRGRRGAVRAGVHRERPRRG